MKMRFCSVLVLAMAPFAAYASTITSATAYQNVPFPGDSSDTRNFSNTLASANFTIGALGVDFETTTNTSNGTPLSTFLNNPTFFNTANGFDPSAATDNTEIVLTGFLSLNAGDNSFVVGHDDGVVLSVASFGNVVNAPGPTGLSESPFIVNATTPGDYAFTLDYVECCGGPADLVFSINNTIITTPPPSTGATPEPSSIALLGTGVLGLAGAVKRRMRKV